MTDTSKRTQLVTEADAAKMLATPAGTLRYWRKIGKGPDFLRPGKRILYDVAVLEDWIDQHRHSFTVRKHFSS